MSEFLIEINSEEIPAKMQNKAAENFTKIFADFFVKQNIKFSAEQIESFVAPKRLVFLAKNLEEFQTTPAVRKNGPKLDANQKAIEGFAKSVGVAVNELNKNETNYYFDQKENKVSTAEILAKHLPTLLQKMASVWPKTMRWKTGQSEVWVRPIRNILAIFDDKIVSFEFASVKSSNKSGGLEIASFEDYSKKLEDNLVIFDASRRKEIIKNKIAEITAKIDCQVIEDERLLDEVTGLVEYPEILLGEIDSEFMNLPPEILVLTIKLNQKYFCLKNKQGNLAPYFILVSNVKTDKVSAKKIIADNKKVLRARLNDAKFFVEEDLKRPLISRWGDLKEITFHEKLGSIYHKTRRLESLSEFLSLWVPHSQISLADDLAKLTKCDLTTKAVAEFPELQGVIGGYYAKMESQKEEIYEAISEHYLPLGPNSELPKTPLGALLAIADKIDNIVGMFLVGAKPTSSKDPYALRRAALGIIRILIDRRISLPLKIATDKSLNLYPAKVIKNIFPNKKNGELREIKNQLNLEIVEFFSERLKAYLKDSCEVRTDVVNEVFDVYLPRMKKDKKCDLLKIYDKALFIDKFVSNPVNFEVINLYKRAANIVAIEEKKDNKKYDDKPSPRALDTKYEELLYKKIKTIAPKIKKLIKHRNYDEAFILLADLQHPISYFFDHVVVNVEEKNLRENRLLLLNAVKELFESIFNFSKIEL